MALNMDIDDCLFIVVAIIGFTLLIALAIHTENNKWEPRHLNFISVCQKEGNGVAWCEKEWIDIRNGKGNL